MAAVVLQVLPWPSLLALVTLPVLIKLISDEHRVADQPKLLTPQLGLTILLCHLFPILLLAGLLWAA